MLLCFVVKKTVIWYKNTTATTNRLHTTTHLSILSRSHNRAQMTIGHIISVERMNEYIDGQFLAGGCSSRQRQVADGPMGPM